MESEEAVFESLYYDLQKCYKLIHDFDLCRKKDHPIMELSEAFSLCSGAFYNLCNYYNNFHDLSVDSKIENNDSWAIFESTKNFQSFSSAISQPSDMVQLDFRSMCFANVAFRLSAAGILLCHVMQEIQLNDCKIGLSKWPYMPYYRATPRDWERSLVYKKNGKCIDKASSEITQRNFALLIALRDEYGHSEFEKSYECRAKIREKYYRENIVFAEIEILQNCIELILHLCENYKQELSNV